MAWSKTVTVGNWDSKFKVTATLLEQDSTRSRVKFELELYNGGNSTSYNSSVPWSVSGDMSKSSANASMSVPSKSWDTIGTYTAWITHGSDGTKTAKVTGYIGATGTSTFGTVGSNTLSFTLPRIAQPPATPAAPTLSGITASSVTVSYKNPANNGATINGFRIRVSPTSSVSGAVVDYVDTNGSPAGPSGLNPNTKYWVWVNARNSAGYSSTSGSATFTTLPLAPDAPNNFVITRNSDTQQTLSWNNRTSGTKPYSKVVVQRQPYGGAWSTVATLGATATSYVDKATAANQRYHYQIRSENAAGSSVWVRSTDVSTTPKAPTTPTVVKGGTSAVVSFVSNSKYWGADTYIIQDNPAGAGWVTVGTVTQAPQTNPNISFTHTGVDTTKTHQYRVQVQALTYATGSARLSSAWSSSSAVVQLIAAPLAPTRADAVNISNKNERVMLTWNHNAVDSTAQSAYRLQYRFNGGSWTVVTGLTAQTYPAPIAWEVGLLEWQVQTKGEHPSYSPYSAIFTVQMVSQPSAIIETPEWGETVGAGRVNFSWSYFSEDGSPQTEWQADLMTEGRLIASRSGAGAGTSFESSFNLEDQTHYAIALKVRSGYGLWSEWAFGDFYTDFPVPVTAEVLPVWDEDTAGVVIQVEPLPAAAQYDWTGGVNVSTSTRTTDTGALTNLVKNPSFGASESTMIVWQNLVSNPRVAVATTGWGGFAAGGTAAGALADNPMFLNAGLPFSTCYRYTFTAPATLSGGGPQLSGAGADPHPLPVTAGTTYTASAYVAAGAAVPIVPAINWHDENGAVIGTTTGDVVTARASSAARAIVTGRAPEGAKHVTVTFSRADVDGTLWQAGEHLDVTAGHVVAAPAAVPYADGAYSPDPDLTASWDGEAHGSKSTLRGARPIDTTGTRVVRSTQWASTGAQSLRVIPVGTAASPLETYASYGGDIGTVRLGLTAGRTYTVAVWCRLESAQVGELHELARSIVFFYKTAASADRSYATSAPAPNEAGVHLIRNIFTVPADVTEAFLRLYNGAATGGGDVWFGTLTMVEGAHPDLLPFDGDTRDTTEAVSVDVQRRIDGGDWVTIAAGLPVDGATVDNVPPLVGPIGYRAVTWSDIPTSAAGPEVETTWARPAVGGSHFYLNSGPDFALACHAAGHMSDESVEVAQSSHYFAGRRFPVLFYGDHETHTVTFTAPLVDNASPREAWLDLQRARTVVVYRDVLGRRMFGTVSLSTSTAAGVTTVSGTITEADYDERL